KLLRGRQIAGGEPIVELRQSAFEFRDELERFLLLLNPLAELDQFGRIRIELGRRPEKLERGIEALLADRRLGLAKELGQPCLLLQALLFGPLLLFDLFESGTQFGE